LFWLETFIWNSLLNKQIKKRETKRRKQFTHLVAGGLLSLLGGPISSAAAVPLPPSFH